jgi:hypothetical protein
MRGKVTAPEPSTLEIETVSAWENALGALAVAREPKDALSQRLRADPAIPLLRELVSDFRAGMIVDALKLTSRLLMLTRGSDWFRALLEDFWTRSTPELFASSEAQAFASYLEAQRVSVPYLSEVLAFERALLLAYLSREDQTVRFEHNPVQLLEALVDGRLPEEPRSGDYLIELEHRAV